MVTAGPFTIRELSGEARVVDLVGRALPYRPLSMRTEQRVELTWLPGAPEATSTVLGAKEGPTTVNGMWKGRFLNTSASGDTPPFQLNELGILTTFEAIDIIDSIVQQGQLLEVTWLTMRRIGHLRSFDYQWENLQDATWAMDFVWIGRGDPPGAAVLAGSVSTDDSVISLQTQFATIDDIAFPSTFGLTTDFVSTYRDFVNNIGDLVFDMQDRVSQFTRKVLSPVQVTRGLIATLKSIEDEATLILAFLDGQVAGNLNNSSPIGNQPYNEKIDAERYRAENRLWSIQIRRISRQQRDALVISISGDLAGTYVARELDDLRDVSKLFYRTPFEWRRIMLFNNFRNAELVAGQFVLVPRFSPDGSNQLTGGA